jgi:chromosome segregation ATPase
MYYENFGPSGAPTAEEQHTWFSENGYEQIPDEEVPCWVCEGKGQIVTETTLDEALEDLGTQRIHQHFDERLLDLESDIKAIPHLMDRIRTISNASHINDQMIINLTKEIRALKALFSQIQEFATHVDAKVSREARSVEALEGFVSRISDRMNRELENMDHFFNHFETIETRIDNLETSLNQNEREADDA